MFSSIKPKPNSLSHYNTCSIATFLKKSKDNIYMNYQKSLIIKLLLWEPKMCRLAWQLLGTLGNILGHPRHALQRPRHACNVLGILGMHFCKVLGVPHRRNTNVFPMSFSFFHSVG